VHAPREQKEEEEEEQEEEDSRSTSSRVDTLPDSQCGVSE
jgi:hypothetical protein